MISCFFIKITYYVTLANINVHSRVTQNNPPPPVILCELLENIITDHNTSSLIVNVAQLNNSGSKDVLSALCDVYELKYCAFCFQPNDCLHVTTQMLQNMTYDKRNTQVEMKNF